MHNIHFYSWAIYSHLYIILFPYIYIIYIYIFPYIYYIILLIYPFIFLSRDLSQPKYLTLKAKVSFWERLWRYTNPSFMVKTKSLKWEEIKCLTRGWGNGELKVKIVPWFSGPQHISVCYTSSYAVAPKEISDRNTIKFHTPLGNPRPPFLPKLMLSIILIEIIKGKYHQTKPTF